MRQAVGRPLRLPRPALGAFDGLFPARVPCRDVGGGLENPLDTPQGSRIVGATSEAMILFDSKLSKLWSRPLPSSPVVTAVWSDGIVTGLSNGQLCFYTLDGQLTHVFDNSVAWAAMLVCGKTLYATDCDGTLRQFQLQ